DREYIFSKSWQYVGHVSQVAEAGQYLTATVADNPVVVLRDTENHLRGFYNVCRHRGGPLVTDARGTCNKVLQCQYHGWTYKTDGSLRGIPRWNYVDLFDKKDYGLVPLQVDVWGGLVFVSLEKEPMPLTKLFQGAQERISRKAYDADLERRLFSDLTFYKRIVYPVHANWKVYADNYLEGYHLPFVHPELTSMLDYAQYVTETYEYYSIQYSPFSEEGNVYKTNEGEALYYFVWPNFMLNILPGRLQVNRIIPDGHERCHVIFDYFYADLSTEAKRAMAEDDIAYSDKVQKEDCDICEHVHKGLMSDVYDRGRFSVECENGVYHFQNLLKKNYQSVSQDNR
ncbi:MAG TPA: aromatic ring-hydroxylating dioxygenase subunit alpha, partial [bacterium]|nr:aromatic ring-hydroxylating dioxygenase subunit alpha [bacterium]